MSYQKLRKESKSKQSFKSKKVLNNNSELKKDMINMSIISLAILIIIGIIEFISKTFNLPLSTVTYNVTFLFYMIFIVILMVGMVKSMKEPLQKMKEDIKDVNEYYDNLEKEQSQTNKDDKNEE